MKKHLSGEKIDLKTESRKISFLVFFLLFASENNSQIPINGFCKFKSYQFSEGYSKIFSLNYNGDAYTDLILFNPMEKKYLAVTGEKNESFAREAEFEFPFRISNLAPIREANNEIKRYVFTSRMDLTMGICEFSSVGKSKVTNKISFDSYPEKISVADVDGDSAHEFIISGTAFEGLSILKLKDNKLDERKITATHSYSKAIFVDLSNDGYSDIAALNAVNNSLEFYFNDGRGNFKLTRTFSFDQKAANLYSFDMNLDSYQDLIFTQGNSIKILCGDFSSSYSKQIEIRTALFPDEFITGDFNKDGKIDLAYLNLETSIVSVIFAQDEFKFYPEIKLLRKNNIKSFLPFYSRFIDGLAALCGDGTLITNTKLTSFMPELDMSLSLNAVDLTYFDAHNNSINDLCFIDSYDRNLKIIIRNFDGIPALYYSIQLKSNHDNVLVNNYSKNIVEFICFKNGQKLIESIKVNFGSVKILRSEFYSTQPISQVKLSASPEPKLFVSSLSNGSLSIEIFEKRDSWILSEEKKISDNVIGYDLSLLNEFNLFIYKYENDSLYLYKRAIYSKTPDLKLANQLLLKGVSNLIVTIDDYFNLDEESIVSFVEADEKRYILVGDEKNINIFNLKNVNDAIRINNKSQLFTGEIKANGNRRFIVNNIEDESIYKLNILRRGKKILFSKMLDNIKTNEFFIKDFTVKKYQIVFVNLSNNCISFRQI